MRTLPQCRLLLLFLAVSFLTCSVVAASPPSGPPTVAGRTAKSIPKKKKKKTKRRRKTATPATIATTPEAWEKTFLLGDVDESQDDRSKRLEEEDGSPLSPLTTAKQHEQQPIRKKRKKKRRKIATKMQKKLDRTRVLNVDKNRPIAPAATNPPTTDRRRRSKKRKVKRKRKTGDVTLDVKKVSPSVLVDTKPRRKRRKRKKVKTAMDGFLGRIGGTTTPRTPSFVVPSNERSDSAIGTPPQEEEDEDNPSSNDECTQHNEVTTSPTEVDILVPTIDVENDESNGDTSAASSTQVTEEEQQQLFATARSLGGDSDDAKNGEGDESLAPTASSVLSIDPATVATPMATVSSLSHTKNAPSNKTGDAPEEEAAVPLEHRSKVIAASPQYHNDGNENEDMANEEKKEQDHQIQTSAVPLQSDYTDTTEVTVCDVDVEIHAASDDTSEDEGEGDGDDSSEEEASRVATQHPSLESSTADDAPSCTEGNAQQDTEALGDVALTHDAIESSSYVENDSSSENEAEEDEDEDNSDAEEDGDGSDGKEGEDKEEEFSESSEEMAEAEGQTSNDEHHEPHMKPIESLDNTDVANDDDGSSDNDDREFDESDTDAGEKEEDVDDQSNGDGAEEDQKYDVVPSKYDEIVTGEDVDAPTKLRSEATSSPEMPPDEPTESDGIQSKEETVRKAPSNTDILISAVTWNLAEESPSEADADFIKKFRRGTGLVDRASDLVLFSGQECENIKPRRTEGRRSQEFRRLMVTMLGKDYVPLALHLLGGIQFGLFCRRDILDEIEQAYVADVTCGVGNVFHNKGGIGCFVQMKARSGGLENTQQRANKVRLLFVAAHMAAHVKNTAARDSDFWRIMGELEAQAPARFLPPSSSACVPGSRLLEQADKIFFCGDLNYRIDMPREEVETTVMNMKASSKQVVKRELRDRLMRHDQLRESISLERAFPGFSEGEIDFPPTFKFDKQTDEYDTSHKQRVPAWTDRILFKGEGIHALEYDSILNSQHSDHRPVSGTFQVKMLGKLLSRGRKRRRT